MNDLFGSALQSKKSSLSWTVKDEGECYKHRDLGNLSFPPLPADASQKRAWFSTAVTNLAAIDISVDDLLTKWLLRCKNVPGDAGSVLSAFHNDSQG